VAVYDLRGELVRVLHDGPVAAGTHRHEWDGRDRSGSEVASGVYLIQIEGFGTVEVRKLALLR
jgi:flagellar hook assembly protein FlgD